MDQPDNVHAETMEYAARLIEEVGLGDLRGVFAKKKRVREDAELRWQARAELRAEMARLLRAMTNRDDLSAVATLQHIAGLDERSHTLHLRDAWPLTWKGWLKIEALLVCNSNHIPPECSYRIRLTDQGQAVLAANALAVPA